MPGAVGLHRAWLMFLIDNQISQSLGEISPGCNTSACTHENESGSAVSMPPGVNVIGALISQGGSMSIHTNNLFDFDLNQASWESSTLGPSMFLFMVALGIYFWCGPSIAEMAAPHNKDMSRKCPA